MLKNLKGIVIVMLLISVAINLYILVKMSNLESQIDNLSFSQMDIRNSVDNQTSHITGIMEDFKQEQNWISTVRWEVQEQNVESGAVHLQFQWQVKEYVKGSKITFHYKYGDIQEYQSISPVATGNGLFEVDVPIEIELKPEWHTATITRTNNNNIEEAIEVGEEYRPTDNEFLYYISMENNDVLKSSEMDTVYLGDLANGYYGFLESSIHINKDNFNVSMIEHKNNLSVFIKEAEVLIYKNQTLLDKKKLSKTNMNLDDQYSPIEYSSGELSSKDDDFTELVLKITYNNGSSFENKVFSN